MHTIYEIDTVLDFRHKAYDLKGKVVQNAAKMGVNTLTRSMGIMIKRVIKSLNAEQLQKAADIMEQMMTTKEIAVDESEVA